MADAVHGQVLQPGICIAIMDTPEFNRLRKIQQLGLCSRVFKDASHNRFSHSVGVSHLAGKFATELNDQLKREQSRQNNPDTSIIATERDIRCVQIAGLCHDLGHAPFSHVFEKVLRQIGVPLGEGNGEWNHELMGTNMLQYLMRKNNINFEDYDHIEEEDMLFITECIIGVDNHVRCERNETCSWPRPSWLYDIVSNHESGLDVDKLDYLMRDSMFSHVRVGADFDYLLTSARVRLCDDHQYRITFPEKAYMEVFKVFECRYQLHQAVYQHRTVVGLEDLLVDAITAAAEHMVFYNEVNQPLPLHKAIWNCHAFSTMTDTIWDSIVNERNPEYRDKFQHSRHMFERIDRREKYPYVGEVYLGAEPELQARIYGKHNIVLNHAGEKKQRDHILYGYGSDNDDDSECENDEVNTLTEQQLIRELVSFDDTAQLNEDNIIVHFKQAHFGQKTKNPNNEVYFFEKESNWRGSESQQPQPKQLAKRLADEKYSLPKFCDRVIRVYCKKLECLPMLQSALRQWTRIHGCPSPRGGSQSQTM
jgi:HD superfamily phosphohydrolase